MGWTWTHRPSHITAKEFMTKQLTYEYTEVLGISIHNSVGYAAVKNKPTGLVECVIILLKQDSTVLYNQGFKLIWEDMGPFHTDCPYYILALLSETKDWHAIEWRSACRDRRPPLYKNPKVIHD